MRRGPEQVREWQCRAQGVLGISSLVRGNHRSCCANELLRPPRQRQILAQGYSAKQRQNRRVVVPALGQAPSKQSRVAGRRGLSPVGQPAEGSPVVRLETRK